MAPIELTLLLNTLCKTLKKEKLTSLGRHETIYLIFLHKNIFKNKKTKMPLLYTVIARKNVVLARHAMIIGNFAEVTELVLSKIDETKNKKMSYSSDSYMYHYVYAENNLTFLCITDDEFKRSSAFAFLDSIEAKFNAQFVGRSASTSVPLALNNELSPILAAEMKKFNLIEDQNKLMPIEEGT